MTERYKSFEEFWPFYVGVHASVTNRTLHAVGTALALGLLVLGWERPWLWLAVPIAGYGFAWLGHFAVEHNRPATFQYPLWSLRADFKMLGFMLTGRMEAEIKRLQQH